MITVALYNKKTKISPENEERHFYSRIAEIDIDAVIPIVQYAIDGVLQDFDYDEKFSKEAGHYAYVRNQNNVRLTPFGGNNDSKPNNSDDSNSESSTGQSS